MGTGPSLPPVGSGRPPRRWQLSAVLPDLLNYPMRGANWDRQLLLLSLAYAGLLLVAPPLAEALEIGFALQVARRVQETGQPPELPERIPWRSVWGDGLRWLVVSAVYNLPAMLSFFGSIAYVLARYGLPDPSSSHPWPGISQGWPVLAAGLGAGLLFGLIGSWLSTLAAVYMIRQGGIRAAFRVRQWSRPLRAYPGRFFQALFVSIALRFLLTLAQTIISIPAAVLIIGPAVIAAFFGLYHRLVVISLYALVYRDSG